MPPRRKALFTLIMLLLAAVLLELLSFGVVSFEAWRRPHKFRHDAGYFLDPMPDGWAAKFYAKGYDPILGWKGLRYEAAEAGNKNAGKILGYDAEGARRNPDYATEPAAIAAYGDSFTKGAEVEWNETWPYDLSEMLGRYVANYGVGGYGPDQATVKFQLRAPETHKPAIAILCIFEENINRTLNRYRAYYQEESSSFLAFKPRFLPGPEAARLLPSPLGEPTADRKRLEAAVVAARQDDIHWRRKVDFAFPFSLALGKLALLALGKGTGSLLPLGYLSDNLWNVPEARATMDAVVDAFVAEADRRGIRPVVLFLPRIRQETAENRAGWSPEYSAYLDALKARYGGRDVPILDVAEADFEPEKMHVRPFDGHYSPYGNKVVARFLYERLNLAGERFE